MILNERLKLDIMCWQELNVEINYREKKFSLFYDIINLNQK
jgi:hypothetical protein